MGDADRVAIARNSLSPVSARRAVMSGTVPGNVGSRRISRSRRPLAVEVGGRFALGFLEQEVQPAFRGIPIHLFVPPRLFMLPKPREYSLVILGRQAIDSGLDLFYPVHEWILAFSRQMDLPNRGAVKLAVTRPGRGLRARSLCGRSVQTGTKPRLSRHSFDSVAVQIGRISSIAGPISRSCDTIITPDLIVSPETARSDSASSSCRGRRESDRSRRRCRLLQGLPDR